MEKDSEKCFGIFNSVEKEKKKNCPMLNLLIKTWRAGFKGMLPSAANI